MAGLKPVNTVTALYSGSVQFLEPDGDKTGIFKVPVESAKIDINGIIGDIQVDKRFHGGPEKTLHLYAISSYDKIAERFPAFRSLDQIAYSKFNELRAARQKLDGIILTGLRATKGR